MPALTYTVRVGHDEPLAFANQADAWGAANDAIIAAEQGSVVTAIEKLVDLGIHGQASLTDGRLVTISVETNQLAPRRPAATPERRNPERRNER